MGKTCFGSPQSAGVFVIAEVGQNHNGSLQEAINYIEEFSRLGADAVKFQIRDNRYLFANCAYQQRYNSTNSFGNTYGEHREALELDLDWLPVLKKACSSNNIKFMATPFDEPSLDRLVRVGVEILKVASFDLGNLSLIRRMASTQIPLVISTGGGNHRHIRLSIEQAKEYGSEVALLHCVSEYPCPANKLNLSRISELRSIYNDIPIGLSDHFSGILSGPIAYMNGARIFEKHVTFNRASKGTDHAFSLEPVGFKKFTRDLRRIPEMLSADNAFEVGNEAVFKKLGKSIVSNKLLQRGHKICIDDLSGRIFLENGLPVREFSEVVGKILSKDIQAGEKIQLEDLY
jgi:sialic acid synthase